MKKIILIALMNLVIVSIAYAIIPPFLRTIGTCKCPKGTPMDSVYKVTYDWGDNRSPTVYYLCPKCYRDSAKLARERGGKELIPLPEGEEGKAIVNRLRMKVIY